MPDQLIKFFSTFCGIGYIPKAPGSLASIAALGLCLLLERHLGLYILSIGVITGLGFMVCGRMEEIIQHKDPSCIVIDEVAGMLLSFFMLPVSWPIAVTGFFLFRAFDMFKIYPVNRFEPLPGSTGIMMDDLIAGIYTNLTMQLAVRFSGMA